jgi:hypothetical protein
MYDIVVEILKQCEKCKGYNLEKLEEFKTFEELQRHLFETYENHNSSFFEIIDPTDNNDNYKKVKERLYFMKCDESGDDTYSVYASDETLEKYAKFRHLTLK